MDAAELDSFHRDGFLAVPGVLSADTVARMNGIIDEAAQQRQSDAEGTTSRDDHSVGPFYHYFDGQRQPAPTQTTPDRFWFAQLDPCFVELMAHPAAVERVRSLCGAAARLDHSYGIQMGRDWNGNENLHGGPKPDLASNQYYTRPGGQGRAWSGMVVVEWALTDVGRGEGGFVSAERSGQLSCQKGLALNKSLVQMCVPGSHRRPPGAPKLTWEEHGDQAFSPPLRAGDFCRERSSLSSVYPSHAPLCAYVRLTSNNPHTTHHAMRGTKPLRLTRRCYRQCSQRPSCTARAAGSAPALGARCSSNTLPALQWSLGATPRSGRRRRCCRWPGRPRSGSCSGRRGRRGRPSPHCRRPLGCDDNALSDNALAETPPEARSIAHCQSLLSGAAFARSLPTAPIIQSHASRNGIACTSSLAHILFCSAYASEWLYSTVRR